MSSSSITLSTQEWAARFRCDDGEQQPISPIEREFGLESQARRHGLELMRPLMGILGNPQLSYPTLHVGGSKGKGSTVAIASAILRAAGYRVGMYTSPSLTHFGERIQIDAQPLSDAQAEVHVADLRRALAGLHDRPRFFEAATAIAFKHFAEQAVDVAVVEVGLGGTRDATNVVAPEVSVITSIELEHTHILGDTLAEIAREKAGIIKRGVPVVAGALEPEPLEPIAAAAREAGSALWLLNRDFGVERLDGRLTHQRFDWWSRAGLGGELRGLTLKLPGDAQSQNAALAIAAVRLVGDRLRRVSELAIRRGLEELRWAGRLELRAGEPAVLLDVAHTPASACHLRRYVDRFFAGKPRTLVIGLLRDKNVAAIAAELAASFDTIIVAPVKWFRSMEPELLQSAFLEHREPILQAPSVCTGVELALRSTPPDGLVVVAGSLFAVGEAKRRFRWL